MCPSADGTSGAGGCAACRLAAVSAVTSGEPPLAAEAEPAGRPSTEQISEGARGPSESDASGAKTDAVYSYAEALRCASTSESIARWRSEATGRLEEAAEVGGARHPPPRLISWSRCTRS